MKILPKQLRIYAIILSVLAFGLMAWSAASIGNDIPLFRDNWLAAAVFVALAIFLELTAVETPTENYVSIAFSAYLPLFLFYDFSIAISAAGLGLLLRELILNKHSFWSRWLDFSVHLIPVAMAAVVFSVLNGSAPFLSPENMVAIAVCAAIYYIFDYFLRFSAASLMDEEHFTGFKSTWKNYILPLVSLVPLAGLMILTYQMSPLLVLTAAIPLYAILQSVRFGMREIVIADQERLVRAIEALQTNLKKSQENNQEIVVDRDKRQEEQTMLVELGEQLGTSVDIRETLEIVVSMIRRFAPYQSCVIFLIEEGTLTVAKEVTPYRDALAYSALLKLEEEFVSMVARSKKPILVPDMQVMSEKRIFKDERSLVCVPLIVKNEIIGVIYVGATQPGTYNEDHLRLLRILGNAASNAIRTAQLYQQTEDQLKNQQNLNQLLEGQNESFRLLLDVGQKLGSSLSLDEAQKIIIDGLEMMFPYQTAAVFMIDQAPQGLVLVPTKYRSPHEQYLETFNLPMDDATNILGWTSRYRKPLILNNAKNSKLRTIIKDELSVMAVPLIVENEVTGAIYVGHYQPDHYIDSDLDLLEAIAHNAAMAIKNAEVFERTQMQAITDGLTGLYTHRYFTERLAEEINHAKRKKISLALVMVDADHFKSYNDTLGHPEGDMVLKTIADLMRKATRDSDIVCRIGGDEFTILLKEIDKENALMKAEAIRAAVEREFKGHKVQITTSIGLACFPEDADNKKDLVASVDAALYKSKKAGRNQVSVASGPVAKDFVKEALPRD